MIQYFIVFVGAGLGGAIRQGVNVISTRWFGLGYPWGTMFINISGSLFLGWFSTVLSEKLLLGETSWLRPDDLRLMIAGAYDERLRERQI